MAHPEALTDTPGTARTWSTSSPKPHHPKGLTPQAAGYVDKAWQPMELLVLLFGVGLAWAQSPHPNARTADPEVNARRRAGAVEAARRIVTPA